MKIKAMYKHCFAHVSRTGVITMMTLKEVLNTYTDSMCRDLKDCGVKAEREDVVSYLSEQYNILSNKHNENIDLALI